MASYKKIESEYNDRLNKIFSLGSSIIVTDNVTTVELMVKINDHWHKTTFPSDYFQGDCKGIIERRILLAISNAISA